MGCTYLLEKRLSASPPPGLQLVTYTLTHILVYTQKAFKQMGDISCPASVLV